MSLTRSSTPEYAQRKAPAVKRLLPPLSSWGARSSTVTSAPLACCKRRAQGGVAATDYKHSGHESSW